jgi:type II secretory pathway predicted ATPase ExeA
MSGTTRKLTDPPSLGLRRAGGAATPPSTYEAYYGLVEPPFSLTPGLRFAYNSRSHATALSQVRQALERREGLMVVTGEVGTGKTMLCRALIHDAKAPTFVSLVLDPCLSAEEILEHVLTDFGVMNEEVGSFGRLAPAVPRHQMLILLQRFLGSLLPINGRAVVVIDEAQHLRPEVLEQIRLWSNFETNDTKLLQIVLAGQSELDDILRRPEMRQIQQRVSRRCELTPLTRDEVAEYIEHRLWVARGFILDASSEPSTPPVRFTPAATQTVAAVSGGIPRLVNLLCDRALELGCEQQETNIDKRTVEAAARRLNLAVPVAAAESEIRVPAHRVLVLPQFTPRTALAAAAGMLLIAAPLVWRTGPADASAPAAVGRRASSSSPSVASPETLQTQDVLKVTVATFATERRAADVARSLAAEGYPAITRRDPGGVAYRLIVGPYVSAEAADAARRALAALGVDGTEMRLENERAEFSADVQYAKEPSGPRRVPGPADAAPRVASAAPPKPAAAVSAAPAPAAAYQAQVQPAIDRLDQLTPFLVSASTSPSAPVLKALQETLTTLGRSVETVAVPDESRHVHQLLTSAISSATTAVSPGFAGDRAAQTRQAIALLNQAKAEL